MRLAFLILPLFLGLLVDAEEMARHQGTWVVTSFEFNGRKTPPETLAMIRRVVEGDHVIWRREGKNFAGTIITLDASKDPKTIDITPDGGPGRGEASPGIYAWEGDLLKICMASRGRPRPKKFEAGEGTRQTLMTLRREPRDGTK